VTEGDLLSWLRDRDPELRKLLGDDAATLPSLDSPAITVDSQIEGIHFPPGLDPALLAHRLLAVNLSDLAAMGAEPRFAFLTLSTPPEFDHKRFFLSLLKSCRSYPLQLAGGDLARCPQVVTTLTLIGERPPGGRWLRRSGGRPEQGIWLGGTLGESALGQRLLAAGGAWRGKSILLPDAFKAPPTLAKAARRAIRRHLRPEPQLGLGRWLGEREEGAALDISDGLALDLSRLCEASGTGARIERTALPYPAHFHRLCELLNEDPLELLLGGGEDYVLLFTLPANQTPPPEMGCHRIGPTQMVHE